MNTNPNNIPPEIVEAIKSSRVYDKLEQIGERYGLMLDQIGGLDVQTRMVLLGELRSTEFVSAVAKDLEISIQTAEKIAADVNTEIFDVLRTSMRRAQEAAEQARMSPPAPTPVPPSTSHIEKVGDFSVIQRPPSTSPQYNSSTLNKESVLNDLENIKKLRPENAENYVEHLLENHTPPTPPVPPAPKPVQPTRPIPPPPPRLPGIDPYREQF